MTWTGQSWKIALVGMGFLSLVVFAQPVDKGEPEKSDRDLAEKLIRETAGDADKDLMAGIIRMMGEASERLALNFDAGEDTVALQDKVLRDLDLAIAEASRRRRSQSNDQQPSRSDRRRQAPPEQRQAGGDPQAGQSASASESDEAPEGEEPVEANLPGGQLLDARRGWGNLPQRERDEIAQGAREQYLERYREWIERYYRALQEAE